MTTAVSQMFAALQKGKNSWLRIHVTSCILGGRKVYCTKEATKWDIAYLYNGPNIVQFNSIGFTTLQKDENNV